MKNAIDCYDRVKSFRKAALETGISKSTIQRWYDKFHSLLLRVNHKIEKKKKKKRKVKRKKFEYIVEDIKEIFGRDNKMKYYSLQAIKDELNEKPGYKKQSPSLSWIHHVYKKAFLWRRKINTTRVCARKKADMDKLYQNFIDVIKQYRDDEVVCLDEVGVCNIGNAAFGYYRKGEYPEVVDFPQREKFSIVVAIHPTRGIVSGKVQKKAFKTKTMLKYLEKSLFPSLPPNAKVVLLDNASFHRNNAVRAVFEKHGIIPLFIPPYSPRCNPIEEVFSVFKRYFRTNNVYDPFNDRVWKALEKLKTYTKVQSHYNHMRKHLSDFEKQEKF